jgi:hypothetical protein
MCVASGDGFPGTVRRLLAVRLGTADYISRRLAGRATLQSPAEPHLVTTLYFLISPSPPGVHRYNAAVRLANAG